MLAKHATLIKELEAKIHATEGKNRELSQKLIKAEGEIKMAQT
jgi:hypothetical protein